MATNTTCLTPTTSTATSEFLLPATSKTTNAPSTSDTVTILTCPHCNRTFTSRIGLVGHLRVHCTETGEPGPGSPTYNRDPRLSCPHCPRAFNHRIGLLGHMCIHYSGIHRNADNTDSPCTPSASVILATTSTPNSMNDIPPTSLDFSCPPCDRNFKSCIGLVSHLRIHRTGAGEPVLGAPT
ncbi:unnamed protein product [Schistocephalus solidus]|uniref:C2H2-type domain-containing protein n=1 Tax=Schistocephalus solidus TaxID=70667 RepID=A0A183TLA9_SCHSO|nr:unnamed protein product [Schistocephalus solidus]